MVTLKDIAKEAGVSVMTVSNIVNGNYSKVCEEFVACIGKSCPERHFYAFW